MSRPGSREEYQLALLIGRKSNENTAEILLACCIVGDIASWMSDDIFIGETIRATTYSEVVAHCYFVIGELNMGDRFPPLFWSFLTDMTRKT
jgi:hypothetical protein